MHCVFTAQKCSKTWLSWKTMEWIMARGVRWSIRRRRHWQSSSWSLRHFRASWTWGGQLEKWFLAKCQNFVLQKLSDSVIFFYRISYPHNLENFWTFSEFLNETNFWIYSHEWLTSVCRVFASSAPARTRSSLGRPGSRPSREASARPRPSPLGPSLVAEKKHS